MTPKEKAEELVGKFTTFHPVGYDEEMTPDTYTAKNTLLSLLMNV